MVSDMISAYTNNFVNNVQRATTIFSPFLHFHAKVFSRGILTKKRRFFKPACVFLTRLLDSLHHLTSFLLRIVLKFTHLRPISFLLRYALHRSHNDDLDFLMRLISRNGNAGFSWLSGNRVVNDQVYILHRTSELASCLCRT